MDLNELFKNVTSFNKEAAMKENMRMGELKDSVIAQAFRDAQIKLASHVNILKIDNPESNLTEFSRNKLSGKMKAMLSVSTTAGLKRLPIHFVVKASVASMVETPEQVVAALENVEGSIDKEVKEILEKQKQMSAYHNDDIEVTADGLIDGSTPYVLFAKGQDGKWEPYKGWYSSEVTDEDKQAFQNIGYTDLYVHKTNGESLDEVANKLNTQVQSSANSNIKVEAKKKEIDLGVRENTYAEQFPVKLLVYPKTYLPELKKGDILNVGGFKYRYIGDEPTISGDTENGINARFELVVSTKKASLNVTAEDDDKPKSNRSEETKKGIEQAKKDNAEYESAQEYLNGLTPEELHDMDDDDLAFAAIQFRTYNVPKPSALTKELAARPKALLKFLSIPDISLFNIDEEATPAMLKVIEDSPKNALEVLKTHKNEVEKVPNFDGLPEFFKKPLKSDLGVQIEIAKTMPSIFDEEMARNIISGSESDAVDIGLGDATNSKNPAYKLLTEFAKENDYSNQTKTNEEIGVEDGPADDESFHTPSQEEINQDFQEALEESKTKTKTQEGTRLDREDLSGLGEGISNAIKEDEERQQQYNEEGGNEDILDDNQEAPKEPKDVKKKTESEPAIEKDADVVDDFTFSEKATRDNVDYSEIEDNILELLKQKYSQLKDIPNDWIEIYDVDWYGTINWGIDIEAREWGLKSFNPVGLPSQLTGSFKLSYFANAEAADMDDTTEEYFDLDFDLQNFTSEIDTSLTDGSDFGVTEIRITGIDSAVLHF